MAVVQAVMADVGGVNAVVVAVVGGVNAVVVVAGAVNGRLVVRGGMDVSVVVNVGGVGIGTVHVRGRIGSKSVPQLYVFQFDSHLLHPGKKSCWSSKWRENNLLLRQPKPNISSNMYTLYIL